MRNLNLKTLLALATLMWAGSGVSQGQGLMDIKDFVRLIHIHGVPYEEASQYDASVVPTLLEMLKDSKEEEHWSNIVATLGMIGDESAVEPMIKFIEKSKTGTLNPNQRMAKTSALMALGYLINKSRSQRALDYLTTTLTFPARARNLAAGAGPFAATTAEQDKDLTEDAIIGLALSGHPEAAKTLRSIQVQALRSSEGSPMAAVSTSSSNFDVSKMVTEALRANKEIAAKGLARYYGKE